ncbi:MAG TPA: Crp/Fnr family transcriptional regulator [Gemmataceae bacterium]|nr:Crp/Fnr family transcriptional regulator [Gemmataceae bacterium]
MSRLEASRNTPPNNRLLAILPRREYQRLLAHLECVPLTLKTVLHEPGQPIKYLYFPTSGMLSLLSGSDGQGGRIEVGVVGREGMVGLPAFLGGKAGPTQWMVQVSGEALRMRAAKFRRLVRRQSKLHEMLLRYTHVFLTQVMQWVSCNSLHPVEKRLCRWLLTVHDRASSDQFPLTHEFLAAMLGVRRASVTEAARRLRRAGLIHYGSGQLTILDRRGLEGAVCGCYHTVRAELVQLFG